MRLEEIGIVAGAVAVILVDHHGLFGFDVNDTNRRGRDGRLAGYDRLSEGYADVQRDGPGGYESGGRSGYGRCGSGGRWQRSDRC